MKQIYFPKFSFWLFLILFLVIAFLYNYNQILFMSPQSTHLWRQCDCLSITMNYYQDDNNFLEPSMHNLSEDGTGKTVSEFPVIYYTVSGLWKIFGQHEYIYRAIVLLFFFMGLMAVFKLFEFQLKDSILAIIMALFLFTSPTLVYYANNFLMDIPALSLAFMGLYFFMKFTREPKNRYLYLFALFYTLSGLLKISSLLSFMAIWSLFILELLNVKLKPGGKVFTNPGKQIIPLIIVLLVQVIWYRYAWHYNNMHNGGLFLIGILPIWELGMNEIKVVVEFVAEHIKWDYFRRETQILFLLMFIFVLANPTKKNRLLYLLTLISSFGFFLFLLLFFQPLKDHDYYTINLFILVPIVLLSFFSLLKNKFPVIYGSLIVRILIVAFLVHNIDFSKRRIENRYSQDGWHNSLYVENVKALEEIGPLLTSLGIDSDDKILSLSDNSINISLYFMNRKGWTNYGVSLDSLKIEEKKSLGARYLIVWDEALLTNEKLLPYFHTEIGQYENIRIFKL